MCAVRGGPGQQFGRGAMFCWGCSDSLMLWLEHSPPPVVPRPGGGGRAREAEGAGHTVRCSPGSRDDV